MTPIAPLITSFMREHMPQQRGYSPHSCETYAYSFQLLFAFAAQRLHTRPSLLQLEQIDADMVVAFLHHIEHDRGNSPATRNLRLAAIKSFMRYVELRHPSALEQVAIGDALLAYIERGRPALATPSLFITEYAPLRPIDRITVKCLVKRALKRAGVESRYKGAHILRHSAATAMLRHGVSLPGVSTVLRHRSQAMTAHYAKVDIALLAAVAQPWPGRSPC